MKKLVTLVLLAVVALTPLFSHSLKKQPINSPVKPIYLNDDMERGDAPVPGDIQSFEQGANGYGWFLGTNDKVSYDPETNTFASSYRVSHPSGSGTAGFSWGNFGEDEFDDGTIIFDPAQTGSNGTRYPFTLSKYGHHFNVATDYTNTPEDSHMYVTIMDSEGEFVNVNVIDPDGNAFPGWHVQADITYNEEAGEYILGIVAWKGLPDTSQGELSSYSFVRGTTTDLMDPDSWVFSNYNEMVFAGEENNPNPATAAFVSTDEIPKIAWGKDGFGVIFSFLENNVGDETEFAPGFIYTEDYGQTWNFNSEGKFFWDYDSFKTSFDWWGAQFGDDPANPAFIDLVISFTNTKIYMDGNNKIHFIHVLKAGMDAGEGSYYPAFITNDNQSVIGFYHSVADINTADGSVSYDHNYIATNAGWYSEAFGEFTTQVWYRNNWTLTIGRTVNDAIVYAGWSDRPILDENSTLSPWLSNNDKDNRFICDPYFSYSEDGGQTWSHSETPEGHDDVFYGHDMLNTQDINEEGFDITSLTHNLENGMLTVYSVWQEADLSQPLPPPVDHWRDHVQDYKLMKITASNVEAGIEEVTPTSINLEQNYPNPFNPTTSINYSLNSASKVNLTVFNAAGEMVTELVNGSEAAGNHSVSFDGSNLNSGVYFYKLTVNGISETKKMVLTK